MLTLTIDGREITVPEGTTLLDAAAELSIEIPVICYHEATTANDLIIPMAGECQEYHSVGTWVKRASLNPKARQRQ